MTTKKIKNEFVEDSHVQIYVQYAFYRKSEILKSVISWWHPKKRSYFWASGAI